MTKEDIEEYVAAWGKEWLVHLPPSEDDVSLPLAGIRHFLGSVGLPRRLSFSIDQFRIDISFDRLSHGLESVLEQETVGLPLPQEWRAYLVVGDEKFENGGAWFCMHENSGEVCRIDIELANPVSFVNTSIMQFARSLMAFYGWARTFTQLEQDWQATVSRLDATLDTLDPQALATKQTFWAVVISGLRTVDCSGFQWVDPR